MVFIPLAQLIFIKLVFFCSLQGDYPSKPITVIVPFAAGGGSDVFVRIFQNAIRKNNLCPQPIVIKNIAGAGGTIGSRSAKNATPDGHTILCLHDGIYTAQHYGNADWGPDNFEPIAATGRSGVVVAVEEDSPYTSLNELMEEARDRPYQLVYGTNLGAPNHYSALFLQNGKSGAKFRFTQTGGGAKRLAQLKGGHIDLTGFSVAEYQQFKDAGIKALASLGEERESSFPNLTTALEQEVRATHDLMQFWWAPQNTPPERIAYLQNLLAEAMATREIKESFQNLHMDPVLQVGQDLLKTIADRSQKLQGITIDKPTALPPLEWIILGITVICFVFVLRESKSA
ncbi:MAG: tripartite tricarboxylate transporter substrate binding protein [Opitutales bacterium]